MWRRIKWPLLVVATIVVGFAFRNPAEKYFDIAKSLDIFATLFKEVNAYYVDEVDPEKLIRRGIDGMLETLDPYTDYIAEKDLETFRIATTGQYAGIGALIGIVNEKAVITHPYKGFPAYTAGLRVGDEIVSINGINAKGKSTSAISVLLKGQPTTDVSIGIRRPGVKGTQVIKITREKITLSNVAYAGLIEPSVGYIRLDDFTPGASREVSDAVIGLKEKGARSLVLDLRDNPGGLLQEAVNIVNIFIPRGQEVVSTKGKVEDWNKSYKTLNSPVDIEIPLVILVSEESASASEIVAGALQDYDRGILIGKRTFGKGLVQTTRPLAYNAQLKVTTARYYIPSGRCIQALDYAHRKEDGSVERLPDSLKSEFKTRNGRKVFDGGGLDPDIVTADQYVGTVTAALIDEGLIFEYASAYCALHPEIPALKSFHMKDQDYDDFLRYLKTQKFEYESPVEENAKALLEAAKQERYYAELQSSLKSLKDKIDAVKAADFVRFKREIIDILEEQIGFHYALFEGQAAVSLDRDSTLIEARKILLDPAVYRKTLIPVDGHDPKP